MPFTPYHFGPALLVGLVLFRRLDLPTFVVANVVVDVRAALVYFGHLDGPLHGPLTTLTGGAVVAALLAAAVYPVRPWIDPVLDRVGLAQSRSAARVAVAALAGVWLHVALDATLYADVRPFAPFASANPLLGAFPSTAVYLACIAAGLLGAALYALHLSGVAVPGPDGREGPLR